MSLSNPIPRQTRVSPPYACDGINATFGVPFWFLDVVDLVVQVTNADGSKFTLANGVGYSATGAGQSGGGNVILATPPLSGAIAQVFGRRLPSRLTSVFNGSFVNGQALDGEQDAIAATLQELRRDVDALQDGAPSFPPVNVATTFGLGIRRVDIPTLNLGAVNSVNVAGYAAYGDGGGGARYIRGLSTGPGAIQDATGAWWVLDLSGGIVEVGWFGADRTGVAESTLAVQAALNAASLGMTVYAPGIYYVGNLTVPAHVTLLGSHAYPDALITAGVGSENPYLWKGQFRQKIGTTITAGQGVVFRNCLFIREGLSLPVTTPAQATTLLTQMSGTGVTSNHASVEFDHVAMFGHNIPINSDNSGGTALSNRVKIRHSIFDNLNGPKLSSSGDPAIVEYNHISVPLTMGVTDSGPTGTTPAILERPGVGLWLTTLDTESRVFSNLVYGYHVGIKGWAISGAVFAENRVEFAPTTATGTIGFSLQGTYLKLFGNFAIGFNFPYSVEVGAAADGTNLTIVTGNSAICKAATDSGFRFVDGRFDFADNYIQNCTVGPGVRVMAGVLSGRIGYNTYSNTPTKLENNSAGPIIVDGFSTTPTVTANYTVLASDKSVTCNGAASITLTLPAAANYPGRKLVVRTIAAFTVVSASANVVPLAGGAAGTAILAATAGKWAELESDGTNWQIVAAN